MTNSPLRLGDVLMVDLPDQNPQGGEQEGKRPVVVVGMPSSVGPVRYPMLVIAPLTTTRGEWVTANPLLYPTVKAPLGGLTRDGVVMLDQMRAVDPTRVLYHIGHLSDKQRGPLTEGLKLMFGL